MQLPWQWGIRGVRKVVSWLSEISLSHVYHLFLHLSFDDFNNSLKNALLTFRAKRLKIPFTDRRTAFIHSIKCDRNGFKCSFICVSQFWMDVNLFLHLILHVMLLKLPKLNRRLFNHMPLHIFQYFFIIIDIRHIPHCGKKVNSCDGKTLCVWNKPSHCLDKLKSMSAGAHFVILSL